MSEHVIVVERHGSQRYRPTCSCGWVGQKRNGGDPWSKAAALGPVFKHQADVGLEAAMPGYVDLDPATRRRREVTR